MSSGAGRCLCKQAVHGVSRTGISVGSLDIVVSSPHDPVHAELAQRLSPFFTVRPVGDRPARDAHQIHALVQPICTPPAGGEEISVRPADSLSAVNLATLSDGDDLRELFLHRTGSSAIFRRSTRTVCVTNPDRFSLAKEVRRVVHDIARLHLQAAGLRFVEAAAVKLRDGRGVVVPGRSGAGKTSLLIRLLKLTGAAFIANDEVALKHQDGVLMVHGSPIHVALKKFTASREESFADLAEEMTRKGRPKLAIGYHEFTRRLAVGIATEAPAAIALAPANPENHHPGPAFDLNAHEQWGANWVTPWRLYLGISEPAPGLPNHLTSRFPTPRPVPWNVSDAELLALLRADQATTAGGVAR